MRVSKEEDDANDDTLDGIRCNCIDASHCNIHVEGEFHLLNGNSFLT